MNDLTIDLSNAPTIATKTADPWTEAVGLGSVTFTLHKPIPPRGATTFTIPFGPGFALATLEAARATMRKLIDRDGTEEARTARNIEELYRVEREEETTYAVMRSVCSNPGMSTRALGEHMRANGWSGKDDEIRAAVIDLSALDDKGGDYGDTMPLLIVRGARNAWLHFPAEGQSAEAWSEQQRVLNTSGEGAEEVEDL